MRYRVELQSGAHSETLGYLADGHAHHSSLDPFVSRLLRDGRTGMVCLIDQATDKLVARRRVNSIGPSARQRARQHGLSPLLFDIPGDVDGESVASE